MFYLFILFIYKYIFGELFRSVTATKDKIENVPGLLLNFCDPRAQKQRVCTIAIDMCLQIMHSAGCSTTHLFMCLTLQ